MKRRLMIILTGIAILIIAFPGQNTSENDNHTIITDSSDNMDVIEEKDLVLTEDIEKLAIMLNNGKYDEALITLNSKDGDEKLIYKETIYNYVNSKCQELISDINSNEIKYQDARLEVNELSSLIEELDLINDIIDTIKKFEESEANYTAGLEAYLDNDLLLAKDLLAKTIEKDINYELAQSYIGEINDYELVFSTLDKSYKARKPYEYAYINDYVYFPYSRDNTHCIARYNINTDEVIILPVAYSEENFIITGINIIDDYIFFIAGDDVGAGHIFDNPYNIYSMKLDGSNFKLRQRGNYRELYYHNQSFYTVTNDEKLIKYNIYFDDQEILDEGMISEIYPKDDELYYIHSIPTLGTNTSTLIKYSNGEKINLNTQMDLTARVYDDEILYSIYKRYFSNKLFITTKDGIMKRYGVIREVKDIVAQTKTSFIFESMGKDDLKSYIEYTPETNKAKSITIEGEIVDYEIVGSCLEQDTIFIEKDNKLYTNNDITKLNDIRDIPFPSDEKSYEINHTFDEYKVEVYANEEIIIKEDNYFAYINDELCIYIEKIYDVKSKSHMYLSHIISTNPNVLEIGYYDESPGKTRELADKIAIQNNAIFAVNGDFWNSFYNQFTGIVIREGVVYKDELLQDMVALLPEGGFECYDVINDPITIDELQQLGVMNTISFGPVLLDDKAYGRMLNTHILKGKNPRTAIGMINPNHYLILSVDGRNVNSFGMTFYEMAEFMKKRGCVDAYNLDGGQSVGVVFMGEFLNNHDKDYTGKSHRSMREIIYAGHSDLVNGAN